MILGSWEMIWEDEVLTMEYDQVYVNLKEMAMLGHSEHVFPILQLFGTYTSYNNQTQTYYCLALTLRLWYEKKSWTVLT